MQLHFTLTMIKMIFVWLLMMRMSTKRRASSMSMMGMAKSVSRRIHPTGDLVSKRRDSIWFTSVLSAERFLTTAIDAMKVIITRTCSSMKKGAIYISYKRSYNLSLCSKLGYSPHRQFSESSPLSPARTWRYPSCKMPFWPAASAHKLLVARQWSRPIIKWVGLWSSLRRARCDQYQTRS